MKFAGEPIVTPPVANKVQKDKYTFGPTYLVRLRQHTEDNFSGLWDLDLLDKKMNVVKVISQADNLNICLENLEGDMESDGF